MTFSDGKVFDALVLIGILIAVAAFAWAAKSKKKPE